MTTGAGSRLPSCRLRRSETARIRRRSLEPSRRSRTRSKAARSPSWRTTDTRVKAVDPIVEGSHSPRIGARRDGSRLIASSGDGMAFSDSVRPPGVRAIGDEPPRVRFVCDAMLGSVELLRSAPRRDSRATNRSRLARPNTASAPAASSSSNASTSRSRMPIQVIRWWFSSTAICTAR